MSGLSEASARLLNAKIAGLPVAPDTMPAAMSNGMRNTYTVISSTVTVSTDTSAMPKSR